MKQDVLAHYRYLWEEKLDEHRLVEVIKDGKVIGHFIRHVPSNTIIVFEDDHIDDLIIEHAIQAGMKIE